AGVVGGILIDLFIYLTGLLPNHQPLSGMYLFVASSAIGKAAYTTANAVWLGAFMHFCVSIGWGIGYAYLANSNSNIANRPLLSGAVFGVVVYIVMQIVLILAKTYAEPTLIVFVTQLIAHCVFFGLPVALIVSRMIRSRA
ncbi:MAG: hypothetical protein M3Y21_10450, partial [Candidatus Eremiobacteraeota bacterium]|nr:hypothetical protein [Candidatus Eremiobacteraeota bacterium]